MLIINSALLLEYKVYKMLQELQERKDLLLNFGVSLQQLDILNTFLKNLIDFNEDLNLVSRQLKMKDLVENHLIDCLLAYPFLPQNIQRVADFGSGGGFPGVVYACLRPNTEFTLYEKSPKKQHYLKSCQAFVPNLKVHGEIPKNFGGVDLVTARAFKPMGVIIEMSQQYFANGGKYFLLKGRAEKINEEITDCKKFAKQINIQVQKLSSPILEVERNLVLVEKSIKL